jgi:hypothetical protein
VLTKDAKDTNRHLFLAADEGYAVAQLVTGKGYANELNRLAKDEREAATS